MVVGYRIGICLLKKSKNHTDLAETLLFIEFKMISLSFENV